MKTCSSLRAVHRLWLSPMVVILVMLGNPTAADPVATESNPSLVVQSGHATAVMLQAFTPDGSVLATGDQDGTVKLWDVAAGRLLATLPGGDMVVSMAFSPDGATLAVGCYRRINLWDRRDARLLQSWVIRDRVTGMSWSPDGATLATADGVGTLWDVASGRPVHTLKRDYYGISDILFSHDGKFLATSGSGGLVLWDAATGVLRFAVKGYCATWAFTDDNRELMVLSETLDAWDTATGKRTRKLTIPLHRLSGFMLSSNGAVLVTSQPKLLQLWDARTGKLRRSIASLDVAYGSRFPPRNVVQLTSDGRLLATLGESVSAIKLWRVEDGKLHCTLPGFLVRFRQVEFLNDSQLLTMSSSQLALWDIRRGVLLRASPINTTTHWSFIVAGGGRKVFTTSHPYFGEEVMHSWDPANGSFKAVPLSPAVGKVRAVAPDGRLAALSDARTVSVVDLASGKTRVSFPCNLGEMMAMAFSPDGGRLVVPDGIVLKVWDTTTGKLAMRLETNFTVHVAYSPDGRIIAARNHDSGAVHLWDAATGRHLRALPGWGPTHGGFVFSADSTHLIYEGEPGSIGTWAVATGRKLVDATGSRHAPFAVSPDGKRLAVQGAEGITLCDATSGAARATLLLVDAFVPPSHRVSPAAAPRGLPPWIVSTPDGYYCGSAGIERFLGWRVGEQIQPGDEFANRFKKSELVEHALRRN